MSYRRCICLHDADQVFVSRLHEATLGPRNLVESANFTLSSQGGCIGGTVVLSKKFRDVPSIGVDYDHEIRFLWQDGADPDFVGLVHRIDRGLDGKTRLELRGPLCLLDGLFATDAESGDPTEVSFSGSGADYPLRVRVADDSGSSTVGILNHFLDQIVIPNTPITVDYSGDVDDDGLTVEFVKWQKRQSITKVFNDLALMAGASGQIYRWGIRGDWSFYFKRIDNLSTTAQTVTVAVDCTSLIEKTGSDIHNIVNVVGGLIPDSDPQELYTGHFEHAASLAVYRKRPIKIIKPSLLSTANAQRFVDGYFARYALPTVWLDQVGVIANESDRVPKPWAGKIKVIDNQQVTTLLDEEFTRLEVDWSTRAMLRITVGRVQESTIASLFSQAGGVVEAPGNILQSALDRFDSIDDIILDQGIELPPPGGSGSGVALALGSIVFGAAQWKTLEPASTLQQFIARVYHGNDDTIKDGSVMIDVAFRAEGDANHGSVSTKTLTGSDKILTDSAMVVFAGPSSNPFVWNQVGDVAWRLRFYDSGSILKSTFPNIGSESSPSEASIKEWPHFRVDDFTTVAVTNLNQVTNYFGAVWSR